MVNNGDHASNVFKLVLLKLQVAIAAALALATSACDTILNNMKY